MADQHPYHLIGKVALAVSLAVLSACSQNQHYAYHDTSAYRYSSPVAVTPGEHYLAIEENSTKQVASDPVSTFSIDVDTASYANVRRFINNGHLPPADAVRIEELVNYFDYEYAVPAESATPFRMTAEIGPTPWNGGSYLLHLGIKGAESNLHAQPARNLVFLLDVSGSMNDENKLALIKKSLRLLVKQLTAQDSVAIVVYAGASGLVLPATRGDRHRVILNALDHLSAGGSTNGGAGIELAYAVARENLIEHGINRVILATDGDFNVGPSSIKALKQLIKEKRRSGVALSILGVGMGNYNDAMLEEISNAGDGNAAYIDTLQEAQKVLVHDINATLQTIAQDTKIQVEFNPAQVASYRLIGYENRLLNRDDFMNDRVDAGDVGAGHTVTALYEITLNQPLRYANRIETEQANRDELAMVKIRYKHPNESRSEEIAQPIYRGTIQRQLSETSDDFRFSAAVAAFGQQLRNSDRVGNYSYDETLILAQQSRGEDKFGYRSEFLQLVRLAKSLNK